MRFSRNFLSEISFIFSHSDILSLYPTSDTHLPSDLLGRDPFRGIHSEEFLKELKGASFWFDFVFFHVFLEAASHVIGPIKVFNQSRMLGHRFYVFPVLLLREPHHVEDSGYGGTWTAVINAERLSKNGNQVKSGRRVNKEFFAHGI